MVRHACAIAAIAAVAACLLTAGAAPVQAASSNTEMRESIMALRGLIDRAGAAKYFQFPSRAMVRPGGLDSTWWPRDPWTGARLTPGSGRGHYTYTVTTNRRRYRLTGYLDGGVVTVRGGMPHSMKLAYDHRGEEGLNLIRHYIEQYARAHGGRYPASADVAGDGAVGKQPGCGYWPSNPWDHADMQQRSDHGSFSYGVTADRSAYTLRLHRALKSDYVQRGAAATNPWLRLLASLEDEILRRSARILSGYVGQWSLQHGGELPQVADLAAGGAVGAAHPDWPQDPLTGSAIGQGTAPGAYTYAPGAAGAFTLTVHLHSGDFEAGGTAPAPAAESSPSEP